jgi:heme exporter protein B
MKEFLFNVLALAEKDVRIELRTKESFFATFLFVVLILFIFQFSFGGHPELLTRIAPGIIWIVIAFSGTIVISHLARREFDDRVCEGLILSGKSGVTLFFAKFISALLFLFAVELITVPLFMFFFNLDGGSWLVHLGMVLILGTIGYAAVGTLFAALLSQSRMKDLLLPIVFYPVIIPLFITGVKATAAVLAGEYPSQLSFFLGFDIIFVTASALLYEFVMEDAR